MIGQLVKYWPLIGQHYLTPGPGVHHVIHDLLLLDIFQNSKTLIFLSHFRSSPVRVAIHVYFGYTY